MADMLHIFTARQLSCGTVMFSELFICPEGREDPPPPRQSRSRQTHPPPKENGTRQEVTLYPSPGTIKAGGMHPTEMPFCYRLQKKFGAM